MLDNGAILETIRAHKGLRLHDKQLAMWILSYRNQGTGLCSIEQSYLGKVFNLSRYKILRALHRLKEAKILVTLHDRAPSGIYLVTRYYFLPDLHLLKTIAEESTMCGSPIGKLVLDDIACVQVILAAPKPKKKAHMVRPAPRANPQTFSPENLT